MDKKKPISLFYSYSHNDKAMKKKLESHLSILQDQGFLESWSDTKILPGDEWDHEINKNLETADIILLLVSSDFINSKYIKTVELKTALERHAKREARVIPVILKNCLWQIADFARLQALPANGKPVEKWDSENDAFTDIASGIYNAIIFMQKAY